MPRDKMKLTVELVRRGATILGEPCKTCGGVQIKYHGKVYCTSHEDLSSVLEEEEMTMDSVATDLIQLVLAKTAELTKQLQKETDVEREDRLVSLMMKYVELLQKLPEK